MVYMKGVRGILRSTASAAPSGVPERVVLLEHGTFEHDH